MEVTPNSKRSCCRSPSDTITLSSNGNDADNDVDNEPAVKKIATNTSLIDLADMSDTDDGDNEAEAKVETNRSYRSKRKKAPADKHDSDDEKEEKETNDIQQSGDKSTIQIGAKIHKQFEDGNFYGGTVISGPELIEGADAVAWRVQYDDGDEEDLFREEILPWIVDSNKPAASKDNSSKQPVEQPKAKKRHKGHAADYETAKKDLCYRMGVTEEEVVAALNKMEPPYGLNKAMQLIHKAKEDPKSYQEKKEKFSPKIGLRIRKNYMGSTYYGTVTKNAEFVEVDGDRVQMWEVTFDDGEVEDMDFNELMMYDANRPTRTHPLRGRQLCALELFSGCGMLTQEFANRKWRVRSFDLSPTSYATDKLDVMKMRYEDLGMVPDFIWASPPCFTYSLMAAGTHRSPDQGQYEKTREAREHNRIFAQMVYIMRWAKRLNPHLIVVIENPVGLLQKMPLMKDFIKSFGLHTTTVHYCAFGRDDKKPTHLWTNDFKLSSTLSEFKCKENKCPYFGTTHQVGARQHGRYFNAAAIPLALAEEVADHVHSTFYDRRIRHTDKAELTEKDEEEFNSAMASI